MVVNRDDPEFLRRRLESERRRQSKKLSPAQVDEIKRLHATRRYSQRDLAIKFGVCDATINHAIRTDWIIDEKGIPRTTTSIRSPSRKFKKLSLEKLYEIRLKYDTGRYTYFDLVHEYKVSLGTISNIVRPGRRPRSMTLDERIKLENKLEQMGMGVLTRAMNSGDTPRED